MPAQPRRLILASGSASRRAMLAAAGLAFDAVPASVDERAIAEGLRNSGHAPPLGYLEEVAVRLAGEKALEVSRCEPKALVIGADQTLGILPATAGEPADELHKPTSPAAARHQLLRLRGRTHVLISAVALAEGGRLCWSHVEQARMTMRDFSDGFVDGYLARAGGKVCSSVGAYQLEGLGIQLFERIEGDYFTILGLPLLPLLAELRRRGVVAV